MIHFLGIEVDITNMTLEELEETRKEVRDMLAHLEHEILMIKMAKNKHSST